MKLHLKGLLKAPYIIGGIILFFAVLWLLNRGSSSSSTTVAAAPNDPNALAAMQIGAQLQATQIAAGVQMANIQANYAASQDQNTVAVAIANLEAANTSQQTQAQKDVATATLALQAHQSDLAYQQSVNNNQFAVDYAKQAYDASLETTAMGVDLQKTLSAQQLEAFKYSTDATLKSEGMSQMTSLIAQFGNPARRQQLINAYGTLYSGGVTG